MNNEPGSAFRNPFMLQTDVFSRSIDAFGNYYRILMFGKVKNVLFTLTLQT